MENVVVQTKKYTRERFQQQAEVPPAKGGVEVTWPFQWLIFKPQLHAVVPFEVHRAARNDNTQRVSSPSGLN
jgi:hypothetical protein